MRIAITGGSGSLGRALFGRLAGGGADRIVTFSRDEQKRAALAKDFAWHPGVRVYAGDVRDAARVVDLFRGCDTVVHGAARKVVTAHPDEPEELLKTNILGTQNVIDACRAAGVQRLVVVSSDKAVHAEKVVYIELNDFELYKGTTLYQGHADVSATMFVQFCDQVTGNSTLSCLKAGLTGSPSRAVRRSHCTLSNGS